MSDPVMMRLCEGCPCKNEDNEYGSECNLGYEQITAWAGNRESHLASPDCEMKHVQNGDKTIVMKSEMLSRDRPKDPSGDRAEAAYIPHLYSRAIRDALFAPLFSSGLPRGK